MKPLLRRILAVVGVVVIAATPYPATGHGAPGDDPHGTQATVSLGWRQLGMSSAVYFSAPNAAQTLTIPVPDGIAPTTLSGVLHSANNIPAGYLEAEDTDGRFLGTIPVPDIAAGQSTVPFTLNVAPVPVRDDAAYVRLILRVTGGDAVCGPPPSLIVSDLAATFTGVIAPPTTVQQFFPLIAPTVDLYVDPKPNRAETQTALNLVTALTNHYLPATVNIVAHPLPRNQTPPPVAGDGLRRAVVIRGTNEAGIAVVPNGAAPYLAVTGQDEQLERQAALFREKLFAAAQTQSVRVESTTAAPVQAGRTTTFGQIKATGNAAVLGEATISLDIGSAPFVLSRPGVIDVHLIANYTPVQDTEKATFMAGSGGVVLKTAKLDSSGHLDTKFSIPAEIAARNAGLVLTLTYQPGPGACTPRTVPMTFQVDPASTLTARPGGSVAMGGFSALPQGYVPTFQVATDDTDPDTLAHAVRVITLIQQMSATELRPMLVSLDDAASSRTGALIIANSSAVEAHHLTPPIGTAGDLSSIDMPAALDAAIPGGLASIQAYTQNNRTIVLITTSGQWSLAAPLFSYLDNLENGWRDLRGDVLVAGQGAQPQTLTIRSDGPVPTSLDTDTGWQRWAWLSTAAVVVAAALIIGFVTRRRRHRTAAP